MSAPVRRSTSSDSFSRPAKTRVAAAKSAPASAHVEARHAIDPRRRHQHADGAARAGARRTDDALDAELARDVPGMDGPRAAGRQQRVFGRECGRARRWRRARHPPCSRSPRRDAEARRGPARRRAPRRGVSNAAVGRRAVDLHGAAQEEVGVEIAQRQIGVGHGGARCRRGRSRRARLRAAALGPDIERAEVRLAARSSRRRRRSRSARRWRSGSAGRSRAGSASRAPPRSRRRPAARRRRPARAWRSCRPCRRRARASRPALRPNQAPASAPAAGPLSSNCTGARLASLTCVEAAVGQHEEEPARECPRHAAPAPGARDRSRPAAGHRRWPPSCWRAGTRGSPARCRTTARSRGSGSARRPPRRWRARARDWRRRAGSRWRGFRRPAPPGRPTSASAASTSSGISTVPSGASRSMASRRHGRATSGLGISMKRS